jgi:hypothetical protein
MAYRFPIARRLWRWSRAAARRWRLRHQHPANFALHLVGIPLAFGGLLLLIWLPWPYALTGLVAGYFLQWIGHRIEGNDVGELIPIKRLLGWPVVAIHPRYLPPSSTDNQPSVATTTPVTLHHQQTGTPSGDDPGAP